MNMKWMMIPAVCFGLLTLQASAQKTAKLKTQADSVSYAIGMNLAGSIKKDAIDISPDMLAAGLADAIAGKSALTDAQAAEIMVGLQQRMMQKQIAAIAQFFIDNKKRAGVVETASGLQYEVMTPGAGASPSVSDQVTVHYKGSLLDGRVFDSSIDRGQPATFPVSGVISGWTEALQLMKVGAKYRLFIPSKLAYGESGQQQAGIPPNAPLVFEVELLGINNK